ncbi:uncharacterized protein LOC143432831 isoform X1 [Xylocopa sonorina]|uniref:uncharacterized protein LOC143432831 isoform X1 n=1 Tax=Xylocopa sonorina TaxID=1818115 RepID=UPI00403AD362
MPDTAITPKSSSSLSASTNSREETNQFSIEKRFTRCVQRKFLTYSQLPVRCQRPNRYYRPPRTSFRLTSLAAINNRSPGINSAKSCPDNLTCSVFHVASTPGCKKSLSMIDLSPLMMEAENGDVRSDNGSTVGKLEENEKIKDATGNEIGISIGIKKWMDGFAASESEEAFSRFSQSPNKAANLVCHVLMLNAWRRRRSEVQYLHGAIDDLNQQIEHLHLQIVVLRRLLDTENSRVGKLISEVHRAKVQYDETLKEKISLRTVTASETLAVERGTRADKAESIVEDLQLKLATQIALVESSQEQIERYSRELKVKEDEKIKLVKRLRSSEDAGRTLSMRAVSLEAQLVDREVALQRVQAAYNSQLLELNELRDRLIRQSQEGGWSSRVLQIAGSVVRAPRAILRTLLASPMLT